MEMVLAILMVLGIFIGIPAVIGFAISGVYLLNERKIRKIRQIKAVKEAATITEEPIKEEDLVA